MKLLTPKEKLQYLANRECGEIQELERCVIEGKVTAKGDRVSFRYDIRAYIRKRMEEEGISAYAMAKYLGMPRGNFSYFINGRNGVTIDTLEEILWILRPGNIGVDEEDAAIRIIKEETL